MNPYHQPSLEEAAPAGVSTGFQLLDSEVSGILDWVNRSLAGYHKRSINDLDVSWNDGLLFNVLIHVHHPHLFPLENMTGMGGEERIVHALSVLKRAFNVSLVISPADWTAQAPLDTNAVILLVARLYQVVESSNKSRHHISSVDGNSSQLLSATIRNIEETLTWLEEVSIKLNTIQLQIDSQSLHNTRNTFHSTEDFFSDLSYQNMEITKLVGQACEVLGDLTSGHDVAASRKAVTDLLVLKCGWECVCSKAGKVQNCLQNTLMRLEREEMESVSDWLASIEDRIDRITNVPGNHGLVTEHITEFKSLQSALASYQQRINDLGNAVILVDEQENASAILEQELNLLGERWARICKWVEERWDLLQLMDAKWKHFFQARDTFSAWLQSQTVIVNELHHDVTNGQSSPDQTKQYFKHLKTLEVEMEKKQDEFSALGETCSEICKYNESDDSFREVQECIMVLAEQWDALVQRMEELGEALSNSDVFASRVVEGCNPRQRITEVKTNVITTETVNEQLDNDGGQRDALDIDQMNALSENAVREAFELAAKEMEELYGGGGGGSGGGKLTADCSSSYDDQDKSLEQDESLPGDIIISASTTPDPEDVPERPETPRAAADEAGSPPPAAAAENGDAAAAGDAGAAGPPSISCDPPEVHELSCWVDDMARQVAAIMQTPTTKGLKSNIEPLSQQLNSRAAEIYAIESQSEVVRQTQSMFNSLLAQMESKSREVNMLVSQREMVAEIELLEKLSGDISEWTNMQEPIGIEQSKIKEQIDQCQSKYWEVQKYRQRLTNLQTNLDLIGPQLDVIARKSFISRTKHLKGALDKSMSWLENRDKRLTQSLDNTPPQRYSDAMSELTTFLDEAKARFDSMGHHVVCDICSMEENVQTCKALQLRMTELTASHQYVKSSVHDICSRCSDPIKADSFRQHNKEVCERWVKVTKRLDERTNQVEKWLKVFKKFNEEVAGLNSWMDQVYMFLHSEEAALGDVATVSAQYEQSKALEDDIATIRPNLATILEIGHQLIERASPKYGRKLRSSLDTLQKKWDKTVKLTKQQSIVLQTALEKSSLLEDSLVQLKSFLEDMSDKQIPQKLDINSLDEIPELVEEYGKILQSISEHEHLVQQIDSVYSEIVQQDLLEGLEDLMQRVSTVNASWSSLKQHVHTTHTNLSKSHENHSELMEALTRRLDWLDTLRPVLESLPDSIAGDAEEISEQLDALDRALDGEPVSEAHVDELATSLAKCGIMVDEVNDATARHADLVEEIERPVRNKRGELRLNLKNVQGIQQALLAVRDWIAGTSDQLQSHLDQGQFSDSFPDEFHTLASEFEDTQEKINELSINAAALPEQPRIRVEQQLDVIRKSMEEARVKFNRFQKPADFDTKRLFVLSQLDNIAQGLQFTDIKDWDTEYLQSALDAHENLYRSLSELKPQVEYVLKTGFSVIENGQADDAEELDRNLCDIKCQFNDLGAQVTAGKGMLECALHYTNRIHANLIEITEWIDSMDRDLASAATVSSMDDLLYDLQVRERDMKSVISDTEELLDLAEPNPLHSLEQTVEAANDRFKHIAHRIAQFVSNNPDMGAPDAAAAAPIPTPATSPHNSVSPTQQQQSTASSGVSASYCPPADGTTWYGLVNEIRKWMVGADKELSGLEALSSESRSQPSSLEAYDELKRQLKEQEVKKKDLKKMALDARDNGGDSRVNEELKSFNSQFNNVSLRIHTAKPTEKKIVFAFSLLGPCGSAPPPVDSPQVEQAVTAPQSAKPQPRHSEPPNVSLEQTVPPTVSGFSDVMAVAQEHMQVEQQLALLQKETQVLFNLCQSAMQADEEEQDEDRASKLLEDLDQQWSLLEPKARDLLNRGSKIVPEIQRSNFNKANALKSKLERFKNETDTIRKQKNLAVEKQWYAFKREVQNFEIFIFEFERKAKQTKGNLKKLSALYSDFLQFRQEFAELNFKARELMAKGSTNDVSASLCKLSEKWKTIDSYFEWFDHEELAPEHASKQQQEGSKYFMVQAYPTMSLVADLERDVANLETSLAANNAALQQQLQLLDRVEARIESVDYEVRNTEILGQSFLESAGEEDEKEISKVVARIRTDWARVKKQFDQKKQKFEMSVNEIQVLSDFLKVLTAWVTKAEAMFSGSRLPNGKLNMAKAQIEQPILEQELKTNSQVFESLTSRSASFCKLCDSLDCSVLEEKIEAFTRRWNEVVNEINARRDHLKHHQPTIDKFLKEIDSLLAWVKLVSDVLSSHRSECDVDRIAAYLETVRQLMKELEGMNDRVQDINEMGKQLIDVNPNDLELVETKLRELNPKYVSVSHSILKSVQDVEVQLHETEQFTAAITQLEAWIAETSKILDDPASLSDLSTVSELKTVLDDKQKLVEIMNAFDRVNDVEFRDRVGAVNNQFHIIADKISNSHPTNIELQSLLRQRRSLKKKGKEGEKEPRHQSGSSHEKFERMTDEIRDWLIILQHLLKSEMVTVGDVNHIRNLIAKQKQILNEPLSAADDDGDNSAFISPEQGDELTSCLSSIQGGLQFIQSYLIELNSDSSLDDDDGSEMKVAIMNKVNSIKTEWEECRVQVSERCRHLEIVLQASETFLNIYDNCRNDLCNTEYKLNHFGHVIFTSSDILKRQMAAHKVIKDEMKVLRKTVEALVRLSNKIISDFSQDNTGKIREMRDAVYTNWKRVLSSSDQIESQLKNNLAEIEQLKVSAKDLINWMREIDVQIDALAIETSGDLMDNGAPQYFQWQVQCKEFQLEIASRRAQVHTVHAACSKGIKSMIHGHEFDVSADLVDELSLKWNSIKEKVRHIRQKLNINMEHCNHLIQNLTSLNEWAASHISQLEKMPSPEKGNLDRIQELYDSFIMDRSHICKKAKMIEANIDLAKQYVQELEDLYATCESLPDARRASIISTASDDSPETAKQVVSSITALTSSLTSNWESLQRKMEARGRAISEMLKAFNSFTASLDTLHKKLNEAHNLTYRWTDVNNIPLENAPEQLEVMKDFESHLKPLKSSLDDLQTRSKTLQISMESKNRLGSCAEKYKQITQSCTQRANALNTLLKEYGPNSQAHLANSVVAPWERTVAPNKVPFYINHKTESTQWDHPKYTEFMDSLAQLNSVRFSAYRTAMKLTKLENFLNFHSVDLNQVIAALDKQDFCKKPSTDVNAFIDVADIINCLTSLFQPIANNKKNQVKLSVLVDLALNFILNVYDGARNGKVRVLSLKVALSVLARCSLDDKYRYLFKLVTTNASAGTITGSDLGRLLHDIMQIPRQLGEIASFGGSNIEPSVRSCLSLCKNQSAGGGAIDINTFLDWMRCEPQSLVWLPVLFRMQNAENARHQAKCNICKQFPIQGFRYRCLKCFNFDMCQSCFLAGKTHKSHKLSHPMQEYCSACNTSEDVKALAKVFKNRLTTKKVRKKNRELGYLPVQSVKEGGNLEQPVTHGAAAAAADPSGNHAAAAAAAADSSSANHMGARIEQYSSRIADAEMQLGGGGGGGGRSASGLSNYSHPSLATLTNEPVSPQQLIMSMDKQEQSELEMLIASLEEENKALLEEYESHQQKRSHIASTINQVGSNTMVNEAQQLYSDKNKLETRMKVLEDQNRQLEAQLERLKKLLAQPSNQNSSSHATSAVESCSPSSSFQSLDSGRVSSRNYAAEGRRQMASFSTNQHPPPPPPRSFAQNNGTASSVATNFLSHIK